MTEVVYGLTCPDCGKLEPGGVSVYSDTGDRVVYCACGSRKAPAERTASSSREVTLTLHWGIGGLPHAVTWSSNAGTADTRVAEAALAEMGRIHPRGRT